MPSGCHTCLPEAYYAPNSCGIYGAVKCALDAGYRHIDCAYFYDNEEEVGRALRDTFTEGKLTREDIFVTSKLWNNFHKAEDVGLALEKSLSALGLSYLNLYLIHWPVASKTRVPNSAEDLVPLEEQPLLSTWGAMEELDTGLVKSIGVSNFSVKNLQGIVEHADIIPAINQVEVHPFLQQDKLYGFCRQNNIILTAYSPLGSSQSDACLLKHPVIESIAEKYEATPAQILISWGISRGTVVIPKSVTPERIVKNFEAQSITLDQTDLAQIRALNKGHRFISGELFTLENSSYTQESLWDEEAMHAV